MHYISLRWHFRKGLTGTHMKAAAKVTISLNISFPCGTSEPGFVTASSYRMIAFLSTGFREMSSSRQTYLHFPMLSHSGCRLKCNDISFLHCAVLDSLRSGLEFSSAPSHCPADIIQGQQLHLEWKWPSSGLASSLVINDWNQSHLWELALCFSLSCSAIRFPHQGKRVKGGRGQNFQTLKQRQDTHTMALQKQTPAQPKMFIRTSVESPMQLWAGFLKCGEVQSAWDWYRCSNEHL